MAFNWTSGLRTLLAVGLMLAGAGALCADPLPGLPSLPTDLGAPYAAAASPQEDLVKMQTQLADLLDEAKTVNESQSKLQAEVDRILDATGVHLGGEAVVHSDNFLRLSPLQDARRTWPTIGYFDFRITAKPRPELEATVVYRMEKIFGQFWGAGDTAGVQWFNVKGMTPIGFEVGMFHYTDTPFTFWAPRDPQPFEPELLERKRTETEADMNIEGNSFPLNGVKLDTTALLFNSLDADIEALGIRTAIAGNKNSSAAFAVTFPFDQYYVGGTFHLTGEKSKWLRVGGSYFELMESWDTNQDVRLYMQQHGNVASGDASLNFLGGKLKITAQDAISNYTPAYGSVTAWTVGNAAGFFLDLDTASNSLHVNALSVDQGFINYAAQSRMSDDMREPNFDFPTGNNLYNPHTGGFDLPTVANTLFNGASNIIFATNQGPRGGVFYSNTGKYQPGGVYLTHGFFNQSQPEGLATPNRAGGGATYTGHYFKGLIQPTLFGSVYNEPVLAYYVTPVAGTRAYTRMGAGLKLDFTSVNWPLTIQGGITTESTQGSSIVSFATSRSGVDGRYQINKWLAFMLGYENWSGCGTDYFDYGQSAALTASYVNFMVDNYVTGVDMNISKSTTIFISYSMQDVVDNTPPPAPGTTAPLYGVNFQNQEFQAKLRMRF